MQLSKEIIESIEKSVLCWLATVSEDHVPNVSPKEVFAYYKKEYILIANIASPQSFKNIKANPLVCVSFIDILVQKGYQLKGEAKIIRKHSHEFEEIEKPLLEITEGKYPFESIIKIKVQSGKPIIAPSYFLYPHLTESERIESARKRYNL